MLLNLAAAALDEVGIQRVAKQLRIVAVEPERAVQVALAGRQFVHDVVVLECDLEDRLLPWLVGQRQTCVQFADQAILGGDIGPLAH